ncbi:putative claudin-24 [Pelobates fuscus]|uniref:putative claudin-24 n=1 Tax=Pelobates fuscus TaxID=191477 RepID=UPI002FE4D15D
MHSVLCFTELLSLFISLIGYICCIVALFIPNWLTFSSGLLVNESYLIGLWQTCVIQNIGSSVCQNFGSLLDLPLQIQMGRVLVCLSLSSGTLGFLMSTPAITCVKCLDDSEYYIRRIFIIFGGVLFTLAGALIFSYVSYFAYDSLTKFWDMNIPKDVPRWEYGDAMFFAWAGGFLLLSGGIVLIASQIYLTDELKEPPPIGISPNNSSTEYV